MLSKIQFIENLSEQINEFMTGSPGQLSFGEVGELYTVLQKIKNNKKTTPVKKVVKEEPKKTNDIYNDKRFSFGNTFYARDSAFNAKDIYNDKQYKFLPNHKQKFRENCIEDFTSFSNPDDTRFDGVVASNYHDDALQYAVLEEAYKGLGKDLKRGGGTVLDSVYGDLCEANPKSTRSMELKNLLEAGFLSGLESVKTTTGVDELYAEKEEIVWVKSDNGTGWSNSKSTNVDDILAELEKEDKYPIPEEESEEEEINEEDGNFLQMLQMFDDELN